MSCQIKIVIKLVVSFNSFVCVYRLPRQSIRYLRQQDIILPPGNTGQVICKNEVVHPD